MFHGLNNSFLYSAYRIEATFVNSAGGPITGSGTGFWVHNVDTKSALVTNRHVLDPAYRNPKYQGYKLQKLIVSGKDTDSSTELPDIQQTVEILEPNISYSHHPENDVACVTNPMVKVLSGNAEARVHFSIPHDFLATREDFESKFSICDFVAFPGYPEWYDIRQQRPVLRIGAIASDPRYDYSRLATDMGECIAYEAFSTSGNSGSPVFALEKGPKPGAGIKFPGFREVKMIGINAGHLKTSDGAHIGASFMYKSCAIIDIIEGN